MLNYKLWIELLLSIFAVVVYIVLISKMHHVLHLVLIDIDEYLYQDYVDEQLLLLISKPFEKKNETINN